MHIFYFAESDPAAVYSAVRTGDISYGQIAIKNTRTKKTGTAAAEF